MPHRLFRDWVSLSFHTPDPHNSSTTKFSSIVLSLLQRHLDCFKSQVWCPTRKGAKRVLNTTISLVGVLFLSGSGAMRGWPTVRPTRCWSEHPCAASLPSSGVRMGLQAKTIVANRCCTAHLFLALGFCTSQPHRA